MTGETSIFPLEVQDADRIIRHLCTGLEFPIAKVDLKKPKPEWFDPDVYEAGRKFYVNNSGGILQSCLFGLLTGLFIRRFSEVLISTDRTTSRKGSVRRYLETARFVDMWCRGDVWDTSSEAGKCIEKVRRLHDSATTREPAHADFVEVEDAVLPGCQTPALASMTERIRYHMNKMEDQDLGFGIAHSVIMKFAEDTWIQAESKQDGKQPRISQYDMAITQLGFTAFLILHTEHCGVYGATEKDLEGYLMIWRSIGYLLGVEDRYNICTSLHESRMIARSVLVFYMYPQWVTASLRTTSLLSLVVSNEEGGERTDILLIYALTANSGFDAKEWLGELPIVQNISFYFSVFFFQYILRVPFFRLLYNRIFPVISRRIG